MSEILVQETCARKVGVLSGPNLAPEVVQGLPAGTLVASRFDEVLNAAQEAFEGTNMHVFCGRDVIGAEVAGAFKNVIAIAAGAADGLDIGESAKALLITKAFAEMVTLGQQLGADVLTFHGIAGLGDLSATCASRFSRNRSLGERLARGESLQAILGSSHTTFEGISCTQTSLELAAKHQLQLPVVDMVATILKGQCDIRTEMDKLLSKAKPGSP
jgi:glycerol-3-phosphate dehydrogenase (NAD(P)+)